MKTLWNLSSALIASAAAVTFASPLAAQGVADFDFDSTGPMRSAARASAPVLAQRGGGELAPYLQCVPYARQVSGVQIYGDARTWWGQAQGRYATGKAPRKGAVMTFRPHGSMELGHVAAVSRVVDSRTVLLDHANWSPIDGRRGQVERDVRAVDVSPGNDWSMVRVWYDPMGGLGTTEWPVEGFIYPTRDRNGVARVAQASTVSSAPVGPARLKSSRQFLAAFSDFAN